MENKRINQGYEIIYSSQIDESLQVVLGRHQLSGMYVTWLYSDMDNYFWGHYFTHEEDALQDLSERIKKERKYNG